MKTILLEPGKYYHIYNQARNNHPIFESEEACRFFLKLYRAHVSPVAETYAYSLMHDHLHLLIRIRDDASGNLFKPFAMLFNCYAKGYNRHNGCDGRLFRFKLKHREIRSLPALLGMIRYINQDPCRHGAAGHPADYRFSSFRASMTASPTMVAKEQLHEWFGSGENLAANLLSPADEAAIRHLALEP